MKQRISFLLALQAISLSTAFLAPPAIKMPVLRKISERPCEPTMGMGEPLSTRLSDSTILLEAANLLQVEPPVNAPKFVWSFAWKFGQFVMPFLHQWDPCTPKESFVNLSVLWWKAIAGDEAAFDMLPPITRRVVCDPLYRLYPKLHHQNVVIRTVFLDMALQRALSADPASGLPATGDSGAHPYVDSAIVVVLGAGFDTRFMRLEEELRRGGLQHLEWFELDLPVRPSTPQPQRAILHLC